MHRRSPRLQQKTYVPHDVAVSANCNVHVVERFLDYYSFDIIMVNLNKLDYKRGNWQLGSESMCQKPLMDEAKQVLHFAVIRCTVKFYLS
ncbi:uncharacterized protein V6R79_003202 [Siganus canaliculatus]